MTEQSIRAAKIVKGMVVRIQGWGLDVDFTVTFARKHRRHTGYMQVQGTTAAGVFSELSLKQSDIFTRVK